MKRDEKGARDTKENPARAGLGQRTLAFEGRQGLRRAGATERWRRCGKYAGCRGKAGLPKSDVKTMSWLPERLRFGVGYNC